MDIQTSSSLHDSLPGFLLESHSIFHNNRFLGISRYMVFWHFLYLFRILGGAALMLV